MFKQRLWFRMNLLAQGWKYRKKSAGNLSTWNIWTIFVLTSFIISHYQKLFTISLINSNPIRKDIDRKSTRLNSSHVSISYAVFCLKKKKKKNNNIKKKK